MKQENKKKKKKKKKKSVYRIQCSEQIKATRKKKEETTKNTKRILLTLFDVTLSEPFFTG